MNKKIPLGLAISLAALCCVVTFVFTYQFSLGNFNKNVKDVKERAEMYDKLDSIDAIIRQKYYGDINQDNLLDAISSSYLSVLNDKWARYTSAADYEKMKKSDSGVLVGIGITAQKDESGYIKVAEVSEGSPAEEAGIAPDSLIISVDGKDVLTEGYAKSTAAISGETGSAVELVIRTNGEDSTITLTRRELEIITVSSKMIDNIGYIKISGFNTKTAEQFETQIKDLQSKGAKALIFDLRNNPGGLLDPTLKMVDFLCPEGVIATATYKNNVTKTLATSDASEIKLPMTVIVNSNTASAAELFSASLRDFGKAELVGETTYGKGVMQDTFPLADGSAVTFTIAKYQTAKTENYDGVGLKPKYEVIQEKDTDQDIKGLDATTDSQLKKAVEVLKTKTN